MDGRSFDNLLMLASSGRAQKVAWRWRPIIGLRHNTQG